MCLLLTMRVLLYMTMRDDVCVRVRRYVTVCMMIVAQQQGCNGNYTSPAFVLEK